ncbi:hypothetical protein VZT92_023842 [Zoarces viviparus]|uniref:Uncharacterized protein n=1 Tax=Zoarces viviparus TaxID=48416 RepID=A0AAW1E7Q5_ZOAVI
MRGDSYFFERVPGEEPDGPIDADGSGRGWPTNQQAALGTFHGVARPPTDASVSADVRLWRIEPAVLLALML